MNKKEFIYESPVATVKEMLVEGMLCVSAVGSELSIQEWESSEFTW